MAILVDVTKGIDRRKELSWTVNSDGSISLSEAFLTHMVNVPDGFERVSPHSLELRPVWKPCKHRLLSLFTSPACSCPKSAAKCKLLLRPVSHATCTACVRAEL
jgi:hypothetical protein